jgi:hypothetical protein
MAGYSARQATYTSGDTITAAHSNDEFNQLLAAFNASTGHTHDGTAGDGGPVTTLRDSDALNKIFVDTSNNHLEFYVEVSSAAVQQIRIQDGAIVPIVDSDIDLGTSSLEFKDLFIDGTANIDSLVADAMSLGGTSITATGAEINLIDGGSTIGTTAVVDADGIIHNDGGTMKVTSAATFKTYFQSGLSTAYDDFTTGDAAVNIATSAGDITIDAQGNDTDIILKGTDGGADTTFLTIDGSAAGKATFNSDVVVGGDLTVTGDDITMGTNTAGNILVADGTNFNSVAVGGLSEISTVANDDVFLAVDTSGGGLKKITRSAVVAGLATSSAISNVSEDTTPQLGGNLDLNGNDIVTTSNADLELAPNGTGHVTVRGNTNQGTIQFNCESNSHGQQIKAAPHSESANNVLTLPSTGGDSRLVSATSTATLTNKTLTTPKIAEIDSLSSGDITLDAEVDINLDAATDVNIPANIGLTFGDDGEKIEGDGTDLTINSSGDVIMKLTGEQLILHDGTTNISQFDLTGNHFLIEVLGNEKDMVFKGFDGGSSITALTLDMSDAGTAVFNHDIRIADDGQIGSASDADAMTISSSGVVTFSQAPVFPDGVVPLVDLDIDGGTDIGADLTTSDLIIVDDGAGGTNRKAALSRVVTLVQANIDDPTALAIALG